MRRYEVELIYSNERGDTTGTAIVVEAEDEIEAEERALDEAQHIEGMGFAGSNGAEITDVREVTDDS